MSKLKSAPPTFESESKYWQQGYQYVIGLDEVGRGPLAGPVVVAAVVFELNFDKSPTFQAHQEILSQVRDSKRIAPKKRQKICAILHQVVDEHGIGQASATEIDNVGITQATHQAAIRAYSDLVDRLDLVDKQLYALTDHRLLSTKHKFPTSYESILQGDNVCFSIASASIIAKVWRDQYMQEIAAEHPLYEWHNNVGYGTKAHREAIQQHGLTPHHRVSFLGKIIKSS